VSVRRLTDAELLELRAGMPAGTGAALDALDELLAIRGLECPSCGSDRVGHFDDVGAHVWFCIQHPTAPITDYFCRDCHHTWNRT
jgi:hypothetical protein